VPRARFLLSNNKTRANVSRETSLAKTFWRQVSGGA
jgi:hypothetical protein